jgi:Leucine-rich repeat (LRR) protein
MTLLESLHLNRNQLTIISPIEKLKGLKKLYLYHNRIVNSQAVM